MSLFNDIKSLLKETPLYNFSKIKYNGLINNKTMAGLNESEFETIAKSMKTVDDHF